MYLCCLVRETEEAWGQNCRVLMAAWVCVGDALRPLTLKNLVHKAFRGPEVSIYNSPSPQQ